MLTPLRVLAAIAVIFVIVVVGAVNEVPPPLIAALGIIAGAITLRIGTNED